MCKNILRTKPTDVQEKSPKKRKMFSLNLSSSKKPFPHTELQYRKVGATLLNSVCEAI
jgi:hypothetical protein